MPDYRVQATYYARGSAHLTKLSAVLQAAGESRTMWSLTDSSRARRNGLATRIDREQIALGVGFLKRLLGRVHPRGASASDPARVASL